MKKIILTVTFVFLINTIFCNEPVFDDGIVLARDNKNLRFREYFTEELSETVEMVFTNKLSGKEIYYTGVDKGGEGIYWIKDGTEKKEIWSVFTRYLPQVRWYGENIAEIFAYGNTSWFAVVYYDFQYNTVTEGVMPVFVDTNTHLVICSIIDELVVIDLSNGKIIKRMNIFKDKKIEFNTPIKYNIKIENNEIIIEYIVYDEKGLNQTKRGSIKYEFSR